MEPEPIQFPLMEYFNYIKGSENSRTVYEGEQVLNAGHLILCGVTSQDNDNIKIYSLCLQTSALQSAPHIIKGEFRINNYKGFVDNMVCSCKAGNSGRCKHISAVLIFCTRCTQNLNNNKAESCQTIFEFFDIVLIRFFVAGSFFFCFRTSLDKLEKISQTDIKCAWSAQKQNTKKKYTAVPIDQMPCIKTVNKNFNLDDDTVKKIESSFVNLLPKSALAIHRVGRKAPVVSEISLHEKYNVDDQIMLDHACQSPLMMTICNMIIDTIGDCCKEFVDNHLNDETDKILRETKISMAEWHSQRKYRITGSRIYEIFTYRGKDWDRKAKNYFWPKPFSCKATEHGLQHESTAREIFINHTGLNVKKFGLIVSEYNPWIGFSPDGVIFDKNNKPNALLEIKCPFLGATESLGAIINKLDYLEYVDGYFKLKDRHKYFGQVQLGMALLNLEICYFVIFCSFDKSMAIIEVPFEYNKTETLVLKAKVNYYGHMLHQICKSK